MKNFLGGLFSRSNGVDDTKPEDDAPDEAEPENGEHAALRDSRQELRAATKKLRTTTQKIREVHPDTNPGVLLVEEA